ncbi:MAG: hypothetical protein ACFFG0_00190 [Candidatus Thorarchaeota archaeon]
MIKVVDSYLDDLQEVVPIVAAGIAFSAANALIGAANLYKKNFTKAARRCNDLPDREKAICMLKVKVLAKNTQLQALKSNLGKCTKAKVPEKCKEKIATKMQKLSDEIKFLSQRFNELKGQKYT